jgi:hypothetical protein
MSFEPRYAVLDESGNVILCDLLSWAQWFELTPQRIIEQDQIEDYFVSTIFMGLNYQYVPEAAPLWFETIVFAAADYEPFLERMVRPEAGWSQRYETLQEARVGHQLAIEWLKNTKLTRGSKPEEIYARRARSTEV